MYQWQGSYALRDGEAKNNFNLNSGTVKGDSYVQRVALDIHTGDASTTYGTAFDTEKYDYTADGLTNGDTVALLGDRVTYTNTQAFGGTNGKVTGNAGLQEDAIRGNADSLAKDVTTNYEVNIIAGDVDIAKKDVNVNVNDVEMMYGAASDDAELQNKYGYAIENAASAAVNGDTLAGIFTVSGYDNGGFDGERTRDVSGSPYLGAMGITYTASNNYNIRVNNGDVTITPRTLNVNGLTATIQYGDQNGQDMKLDAGSSTLDGLVYDDVIKLKAEGHGIEILADGQYAKNRGNRTTADVGEYANSISVSGLVLDGDKSANYTLATAAHKGSVKVTPANLTIDVGSVTMTYGDKTTDTHVTDQYTHAASTTQGQQLVNGEALDAVIIQNGYRNGGFDSEGHTLTVADSPYEGAMGITYESGTKNYIITVRRGSAVSRTRSARTTRSL